jgi:hypothetical protein
MNGQATYDLSGWTWFSIAWSLCKEDITKLEGTFRLPYDLVLTALAYKIDKRRAEG